MPRLNAKAKGSQGEREFCQWLKDSFNLAELPKRDLSQSRDAGADVMCWPFAFEVKRRESLNLLEWWSQVITATQNKECSAFGLEPVVAFRQNGKKWEFLIHARHLGIKRGYIRLTEFGFREWAENAIRRGIEAMEYDGQPIKRSEQIGNIQQHLQARSIERS